MKKNLFSATLAVVSLISCSRPEIHASTSELEAAASLQPKSALPEQTYSFSVLQFNIWQEGTQVSGGYDAIVNEIAEREPDFVTLSEVRNYNNTSFDQRIVASLKAKGKTYYASRGDDNGVLSKYPIKEYSAFSAYHRLVTEVIPGNEVVIYSGHLDYTHYAVYYPRGYDPVTFKELPAPVTDIAKITEMNDQSKRPQQIQDFLSRAKQDIASGKTVILGGDFNEASHLDWTEAVKNLYDHRGTVINWSSTATLSKAGFKDSYRVMYPDEVNYPGFTWPAQSSWTPKSDERDRIDYIFYYDNGNISVSDSYIVGPKNTVVKNVSVPETSKDKFSEPKGIWPTDHKAVWSTFKVKILQNNAKVVLNKTSYKLNEAIQVSFSNGSTDPKAWIGIYKQGQTPGTNYSAKWQYTNATSGTLNFALDTPGSYYISFFKDNAYTEIAPRVYFTCGN